MIAETENSHQTLFKEELLLNTSIFTLHTFWKIFLRAKMGFHEHFMFFFFLPVNQFQALSCINSEITDGNKRKIVYWFWSKTECDITPSNNISTRGLEKVSGAFETAVTWRKSNKAVLLVMFSDELVLVSTSFVLG